MTLSQIQYFLTAARCLNFTIAAKELYITQPALSRQISAMEEELGVELFIRTKSALRLTPAGSMLRNEFTGLMVSYNNILQKTHAMGQEDSILLRIGVLEGYGLGDTLPHFLQTCRTDYPNLMVELLPRSYRDLKAQLSEGELDIILTFRHDLQDQPEILYRELCRFPTCFAHHRNTVDSVQDLQSDKLLILNSPTDSAATFARDVSLCEQLKLSTRNKLADSINEQLFFVRQGYGSAFLAGNCNLRTDPSIVFQEVPELPPAVLVAGWRARTQNPGIETAISVLSELISHKDNLDA